MITTVERNRAAARWKAMMEKDFDIDYTQGINHLPRCEPQRLWNTRHINSVKLIANSTRSLQHWGQLPEATPFILAWINVSIAIVSLGV